MEKHSTVLKKVVKEKATGTNFALYNVYGPYVNRKGFWEPLFSSGMLETRNVILGGDLNLTLLEKENWGSLARQYGLSYFFSRLFESKELVDIQPLKLTPTWRNNRSGDQAISKSLDRFFLLENLLSKSLIIKSWVEVGGMLDHLLVLLQIQNPETKPAAPFKFNHAWMKEEDYHKLIGNTWKPLEGNPNVSYMKQLAESLQEVKRVSKPWSRVYSVNQEK